MLSLAALVLLGLAAAPFLAEYIRRPVDGDYRLDAPGAFARLSDGITHYRWSGPEGAPVLVLIHGLTTSSYVWGGILAAFQDRGWRVLSYDLYGRGHSDRPWGRQDRGSFIRQLTELLAHEGVKGPVTLVGYSMGGAIATAFAAAQPDRVQRLILIAPAGLGHRLGRFADICTRWIVLGDWLQSVFGGVALRRGLKDAPSSVPLIRQKQEAETLTRGYLRSVLSAQRGLLSERLEAEHRSLSRTPVLAIWGTEDPVIPIAKRAEMAALNPASRHLGIAGAGHGLTHTHAPEVASAMQRFLRET